MKNNSFCRIALVSFLFFSLYAVFFAVSSFADTQSIDTFQETSAQTSEDTEPVGIDTGPSTHVPQAAVQINTQALLQGLPESVVLQPDFAADTVFSDSAPQADPQPVPESMPAGDIGTAAAETVTAQTVEPVVPSVAEPVVETPGLESAIMEQVRSNITASGRKMAEVNYTQKFYLNPPTIDEPVVTTPQELQFRLSGKVGERITVSFDYDDTQNKQEISVIYTGDSRDAIQEVNFGNQTLSLPSTEFVAYNKQLFGLSVKGQYKKLKYYFVGSQVQGISATKEFEGKTASAVKDIYDTNYIARKYYKVPHIEQNQERVYVSNNNAQGSYITSPVTGYFDLKSSGVDYSITYGVSPESTVISFKSSVATGLAILVYGGSNYDTTLIKDNSDSYELSEQYELKNRYDLGNSNIVQLPPNDPRFFMSVRDATNAETLIDVWPNKNKPYIAKLDYDQGIMWFVDANGNDIKPFCSEAYQFPSPVVHTYDVHAEYKYMIQLFQLNFNMVEDSEMVYFDGVLQKKNVDYTVDYLSGILTFLNENKIKDDTKIRIDYNYFPFGVGFVETLVGARVEMPFADDFKIGSTYIYSGTPYTDDIPNINSTPQSHQVIDVDSQMDLKSLAARVPEVSLSPIDDNFFLPWLKVIARLINVFASQKTPITANLALEAAYSWKDPNTFGKAMIDDMESAKTSIDVTMTDTGNWSVASSPLGETEGSRGLIGGKIFNLTLSSIGHDEKATTIQKSITCTYALSPDQWVAVCYPISAYSQDISGYSDLEFWIKSPPADNVKLYIDIGKISEDADNDGYFDMEDLNHDRRINTDEDVGWTFNNGYTTEIVGWKNGKLDGEDLNNDFVFNTEEDKVHRFGGDIASLDTSYLVTTTYSGSWKFYRIPLTHQIAGDTDWSGIKHVRIWLKNESGVAKESTFYMDGLSIVGNKWTDVSLSDTTSGNSFSVQARNTVDNDNGWGLAQYVDPRNYDLDVADADGSKYNDDFEEIHPNLKEDFVGLANWPKEQSVALVYNFSTSNTKTGSVTQSFSTPLNFSNYKKLKFWLGVTQGSSGGKFFIRFGMDESNYLEYKFLITPDMEQKWTVKEVDLYDLVGVDTSPSQTVTDVLSMLYNVNKITIGIEDTGTSGVKEVWVNEIYIDQSGTKEGYALKAALSGTIGPLSYNTTYKKMTHTFETIGVTTYPQDYEYVGTDWNIPLDVFIPSSWGASIPYSGSWSKTRTELDPLTVTDVPQYLLGSKEIISQSHGFSFTRQFLPKLTIKYDNLKTDSTFQGLQQKDDEYNYAGDLSYSYDFPKWLWYKLYFSPTYAYTGSFKDSRLAPDFVDLLLSRNQAHSLGANVTYQPVSGVDVTPSYSFNISEYQQSETYNLPLGDIKPASRGQTLQVGLGTSLIKGVSSPSINLTESISESFFSGESTALQESINGNVAVSVSANLQPNVWHPSFGFLKKMYNTFKVEGKGTYPEMDRAEALRYTNMDLWQLFVNLKDDQSMLYYERTSGSNNKSYSLNSNVKFWEPLSIDTDFSIGNDQTQTQNSFSTVKTLIMGSNGRLNINQALPQFTKHAKSSYMMAGYKHNISETLDTTDKPVSRTIKMEPSWSWRITWNSDWSHYYVFDWLTEVTESGDGLKEEKVATTISPSVESRYNFNVPLEVPLPAWQWPPWKTYRLANSFEFVNTTGGVFTFTSEGLEDDMPDPDISNKMTSSTSFTGRISDNVDVSMGFGLEYFDNISVEYDEYIQISASARIVFRF